MQVLSQSSSVETSQCGVSKRLSAPLPLGEAGVRVIDLQRLSKRERDRFAKAIPKKRNKYAREPHGRVKPA